MIAHRRRSYERDRFVLDPIHYLPLPERKTGAQAAPLAGWELPEEFGTLQPQGAGRDPDISSALPAGDDTQSGGTALYNNAANSGLRPPKCFGSSGRSSPGPGWSGGWESQGREVFCRRHPAWESVPTPAPSTNPDQQVTLGEGFATHGASV